MLICIVPDVYTVNIDSIFPLIEITVKQKRNLKCSHFLFPYCQSGCAYAMLPSSLDCS